MRKSSAQRSPNRACSSGTPHLEHSAQTTRNQHHVSDCGIWAEDLDGMDLARQRRKVGSDVDPGRPFVERSPNPVLIIQNEYMWVVLRIHHQTASTASKIRAQRCNRVA